MLANTMMRLLRMVEKDYVLSDVYYKFFVSVFFMFVSFCLWDFSIRRLLTIVYIMFKKNKYHGNENLQKKLYKLFF